MTDLPRFEIHLSPSVGKCSVKMNDQDITDSVAAVSINHEAVIGSTPEVIIRFLASSVDISGLGEVFAEANERSLVDMLDQVDPVELEAQALELAPAGASPTAAALQILKSRFGG